MKTIIIEHILKNKRMYKRAIIVLALVGIVLLGVLKDNSCSYKGFKCDSKSKVDIKVNK